MTALPLSPARFDTAARPATPIVRVLEDADRPAWQEFVATRDAATVFHLPHWQDVIDRSIGAPTRTLGAWRGTELVGIVPLVHVRSPVFGSALFSTGFAVYGGIVADDGDARDVLAAEVQALAATLKVDFAELRQRNAILTGWPTKDQLYATFLRDLPAGEDDNLKMIPRKKRADVRKGIANDKLTVDADAPVAAFHHCYATSVRNLGTPVHAIGFYQTIKDVFGQAAEVSTVNGPDGPVSGLLSLYFKDQILPYYGGALPEARALHAYDFMYWALMRRAVDRGARVFDFGRSKRGTGAFDYKTFWGFEPTPLVYHYHLVGANDVPDINPLNPKYRLFVKTWQRLPLPVANLVGPFVARQLG